MGQMKACIVAVGSEMLTPFRLDTNSLVITEKLNAIGFEVRLKAVVGDDVDELLQVLNGASGWADLIIVTGGLGPTEDDITRDALARMIDAPFELNDAVLVSLEERFARRGLKMPEINRRQAMVPRGATLLDNPNGSAPGLWAAHGTTRIALLPGPPREMKPMLEAIVRDRLEPLTAGEALYRRVVKITGRTESEVDQRAQPVYSQWTSRAVPIVTTILAVSGQIELHLTARAQRRADAEGALEAAVRELTDLLGDVIYSVDGRPLEAVVGDLLRTRRLTIAVAESCTGGLLASRLTDVPGSSDYLDRGVVCYSNRSKTDLLGVPEALIQELGAVNEPVARAMAEGVRERAGVNVGIGVTGIAGPGGGTPEKPVGTVAIAVVTDTDARVRTVRLFGDRELVKFQAAQAAMNLLRLMLIQPVTSG